MTEQQKKPYHAPTIKQIPQPPNWRHLNFQHRGVTGLQPPPPKPPTKQQK